MRLMASGYIHLDAIQNGVFMKALTNKESLALCLFDLAQAYNRSFPKMTGHLSCNAPKEPFKSIRTSPKPSFWKRKPIKNNLKTLWTGRI
jgi:hypothetical protein